MVVSQEIVWALQLDRGTTQVPVFVKASLQVPLALFCSCIETCSAGAWWSAGLGRTTGLGRGPSIPKSILP